MDFEELKRILDQHEIEGGQYGPLLDVIRSAETFIAEAKKDAEEVVNRAIRACEVAGLPFGLASIMTFLNMAMLAEDDQEDERLRLTRCLIFGWVARELLEGKA